MRLYNSIKKEACVCKLLLDFRYVLAFWHLLCNAVDVAAAVYDFFSVDTDNFSVREHSLNLFQCQCIVFVFVLRNDDTAVYDKKVHVGRDADFAVFSRDSSFDAVDVEIAADQNRVFSSCQFVDFQFSAFGICSFA